MKMIALEIPANHPGAIQLEANRTQRRMELHSIEQCQVRAISRKKISENFTLAKFIAILFVAADHYFVGSQLWVLSTVGLFIFAFSSGYFTALKHRDSILFNKFWIAKIKRLGPALLTINLFLGIFFLIQGREGIWHPHTLLALTCLTGLLNWFHIQNMSPFGNGMWFLTVLLIFYLIYPVLAARLKTINSVLFFLGSSATLCILGHIYASPPYMLWPTIFGFCVGVAAGRSDWRPNPLIWFSLITSISAAVLIINQAEIRQFNVLAIISISISTAALLLSVPLRFPQQLVFIGASSVLEIYLIHGYLFTRLPIFSPLIGFIISMMIVLVVSITLNLITQRVSKLFTKP